MPDQTPDALRQMMIAQSKPFEAGDERDNPEAPTFDDLLIDAPLYAKLKATEIDFMSTLRARNFQIDAYCVHCEKESTFKTQRSYGSGSGMPSPEWDWMFKKSIFWADLYCQREQSHVYEYFFQYDGVHLSKIGQYPSIEDISGSDIKRFRGLLEDDYFLELKRATGLASHGIGIGSFVYLRRIFERLVEQHREEFEKGAGPIENSKACEWKTRLLL